MPTYTLEVHRVFPAMRLRCGQTVYFHAGRLRAPSYRHHVIEARDCEPVGLAGDLLYKLGSKALIPLAEQRAEVFAAAQRLMRQAAGIPEPPTAVSWAPCLAGLDAMLARLDTDTTIRWPHTGGGPVSLPASSFIIPKRSLFTPPRRGLAAALRP